MAEVEPQEGVSARKLVLETAKFNVITAHSPDEALAMLKTFPKSNAMIFHAGLPGIDCEKAVAAFKKLKPRMPVIVLAPNPSQRCKGADHNVSSHEPQELLNLLYSLFGDPRTENGQ